MTSSAHPHYVFQREQSYHTKRAEWEDRLPAIKAWGHQALHGLGLLAFMVAVFWVFR